MSCPFQWWSAILLWSLDDKGRPTQSEIPFAFTTKHLGFYLDSCMHAFGRSSRMRDSWKQCGFRWCNGFQVWNERDMFRLQYCRCTQWRNQDWVNPGRVLNIVVTKTRRRQTHSSKDTREHNGSSKDTREHNEKIANIQQVSSRNSIFILLQQFFRLLQQFFGPNPGPWHGWPGVYIRHCAGAPPPSRAKLR